MARSAKEITVKPISSQDAAKIVKMFHYSGKVVNNSSLHFGVFMDGRCLGAMSFGCPMDKRRTIGLVRGTKWNGMMELNRMAFSNELPRNSESRALGYVFRLMKKEYPELKWIISFADATQCGDGAIYRGGGFVLTAIKRNTTLLRLSDGSIVADKTLNNFNMRSLRGGYSKPDNSKPLDGFQLRYVYFLDPEFRKNLTVPEIPFSKIAELGVGMYLGKKRAGSIANDAAGFQSVEGGATPTPALQNSGVIQSCEERQKEDAID